MAEGEVACAHMLCVLTTGVFHHKTVNLLMDEDSRKWVVYQVYSCICLMVTLHALVEYVDENGS